jgi:hypothetical protein
MKCLIYNSAFVILAKISRKEDKVENAIDRVVHDSSQNQPTVGNLD